MASRVGGMPFFRAEPPPPPAPTGQNVVAKGNALEIVSQSHFLALKGRDKFDLRTYGTRLGVLWFALCQL
jgi:hypothetical protein